MNQQTDIGSRIAREEKRFTVLSRSTLGVLSIFHSNASCERLFSMLRRNRTDFRHSISTKLVESLAICKNNSAFRDPVSKELLVKAKSDLASSMAKPKV